jgi:hypothetical protein
MMPPVAHQHVRPQVKQLQPRVVILRVQGLTPVVSILLKDGTAPLIDPLLDNTMQIVHTWHGEGAKVIGAQA